MSPAQVDVIRRALPACPPGCGGATALFVKSSSGRRWLERQPVVAWKGGWAMVTEDGQRQDLAEHHPIPHALLFVDGHVEAFGHQRFVNLTAFCRFHRVGLGPVDLVSGVLMRGLPRLENRAVAPFW